jgi:hypothetical protein
LQTAAVTAHAARACVTQRDARSSTVEVFHVANGQLQQRTSMCND